MRLDQISAAGQKARNEDVGGKQLKAAAGQSEAWFMVATLKPDQKSPVARTRLPRLCERRLLVHRPI